MMLALLSCSIISPDLLKTRNERGRVDCATPFQISSNLRVRTPPSLPYFKKTSEQARDAQRHGIKEIGLGGDKTGQRLKVV
jgi:hypothetical protein